MQNKDIFNKLPSDNHLVNNGVAEVSEDHSAAAQSVLRYELETFVCDGQYQKGLETVFEKFLHNLGQRNEQPGIWISGFYGSGKSHLAKMLRTLWTDYRFSDGATARSLAKLPIAILEHIKELSIQAKRHGGVHAAAGKLVQGQVTRFAWHCWASSSNPKACLSNTTRHNWCCGSNVRVWQNPLKQNSRPQGVHWRKSCRTCTSLTTWPGDC